MKRKRTSREGLTPRAKRARTGRGDRTRSLATSLGLLLVVGCGGPDPRAPHPTRPLDERRAIEIIANAFRDEHISAAQGPEVALAAGQVLEVDVAGAGKRFGVAYVTASEREKLGNALPPRDPARGDALQLVSGIGSDGDARVLVLLDSDYLYDDQAGEQREMTTVTAELKLRRDVRDFLVKAKSEGWR